MKKYEITDKDDNIVSTGQAVIFTVDLAEDYHNPDNIDRPKWSENAPNIGAVLTAWARREGVVKPWTRVYRSK